jgi:anaerobic magnesium-protoporphyrin IX monomethyl ester cyclase
MVDVLLTHCNHLYSDRKQVEKMQPYPPLQTLLAASFLRQEGLKVALFDATFNPPEEGLRAALRLHNPAVLAICEDNFNFLTKMCLERNRELSIRMTGIVKETGAIPVVINSSDASDRPGEYLARGLDIVILGEVESSLLDVARHLVRGSSGSLPDIRGLAFRGGGGDGISYSAPRQPAKDLSRFPMPAWDLVDLSGYREAWRRAHGFFSLNMVSSRGCPYHCNWCAKPIYGQTYHFVPPERTAEEMLYLKQTEAPDQVWFADDIFALSAQWTAQFACAVEARQARIPFKMQSRCDLMTRDTVAALHRAGCAEVWMGAESGSQKILDAMEKGIRVEQIYHARENLRRNGIRACFFLQFGYPGETWEDIQCTINMVRETLPDDIGVSVSYPLPGTKFYNRVAAELGSRRNWSESGDLAMMFRGTYTTDFYTALHAALHAELRLNNSGIETASDRDHVRSLWERVTDLEKTCLNEMAGQWICS